MADREVLIKMGTKIGENDGLKKIAADAKAAATEAGKYEKAMKGASGQGLSQHREMWRQIADGSKAASRNLDDYNRKLVEAGRNAEALNKKAGGGGGLMTALRSAAVIGAGKMMANEGTVIASNLSGARAGSGPMQKGEGGWLMNNYYGMRDAWSGRQFRERAADRQIEMGREEAANRGMVAATETGLRRDWMAANQQTVASMTYQPYRQATAGEGIRAQMGLLSEQAGGIRGDVARRQAEADKVAAQHDAAIDRQNKARFGPGRLSAAGVAGVDRDANVVKDQALAQLKQLSDAQVKDNAQLLEIEKQRLALSKQLVDAEREGIKAKRQSFAALGWEDQQAAIDLGGKLKRGEKLSGYEEQRASQIGVLQPLLGAQREMAVEKSGKLAEFLQATGSDVERAAAEKKLEALRAGRGDIAVEMYFDESKLAQEIKNAVGGAIKEVRVTAEGAARIATETARVQRETAGNRAALVGGGG